MSKAINTLQRRLVIAGFALVMGASMSGCKGQADSAAQTTVEVFIDSGARQCGYSGHPLTHTEQALAEQGVRVTASACGLLTGVAFPARCGARTEKINIHTIAAQDLPQAEQLGYRLTRSLNHDGDPGYQVVPCDRRGVNIDKDS